jgi:hypothetical protein
MTQQTEISKSSSSSVFEKLRNNRGLVATIGAGAVTAALLAGRVGGETASHDQRVENTIVHAVENGQSNVVINERGDKASINIQQLSGTEIEIPVKNLHETTTLSGETVDAKELGVDDNGNVELDNPVYIENPNAVDPSNPGNQHLIGGEAENGKWYWASDKDVDPTMPVSDAIDAHKATLRPLK